MGRPPLVPLVSKSFTHLHNHTEFSMLDGASRVGEVVQAAVDDGQPALAITDHGNMCGVRDFYKACNGAGINPIIGTEAYMAHGSRAERPARKGKVDDGGGDTGTGKKLYYHLTLLAENGDGYRNLIQLASRAFLEGYYYKPRMDWELLSEHAEGLIATTGCLGGHVLQALMQDNPEQALAHAGRLQDIFGKDNLFVEVQDHGIDEQKRTMAGLLEIAKKLDAPLVATNDSHYVARENAQANDALLCVQTAARMSDPDRFKFDGDEFYIKSAGEMRRLFPEDVYPGACDNTLLIAERAKVEIEFGKPLLPRFPLPEEWDDDDTGYLRHLTMEGAKERWGDGLTDEILDRINYELKMIENMGFPSYFLIVWDLIKHARDSGIRVGPGRGSAAGCAVAYCLKITDLDPIKYDLLFERFLNPSRISMPDIDMDFDSRYRDEMIRYATERYGRDHVAQIVTFSTIKARAAVRDAARVLGHPYGLGDKIAKAMPPLLMGRPTPLAACLELDEKYEEGYRNANTLRELYHSDADAQSIIDVAVGLENLRRGDGIHAAAVVITDQPVTEYAPVQRKPASGQDPEDAPIVTQYEMNGIESLGLLKMDFLGLRNLDVIQDTVDMLAESGIDLDIDTIPLDDEKTLSMLRSGDSIGVFQLEGGPMRTLMKSLAPTSFDDIAALVALYRPGPMAANMHNDYADRKNGRKPVEVLHEDVAEALSETYGLMIYQEGMMRVAQTIAGYSLAEADNLRKACGKKIRKLLEDEREKFIEGAEATGYGTVLGTQVFDIIEPFADYAFNKSHAYAYGLIAYQTAWLKAHYPLEYMAALLTSVKDSTDKAALYLHECRTLDIEVRVPDVNESEIDFIAAEDRTIPFGLSAIRDVGEGAMEMALEEREKNGPFKDFYDFVQRVDILALNKKTVAALIKAGAFDSFGHPRKGLLEVYEQILKSTIARRKEFDKGIMSLFGEDPEKPTFGERLPIPDVEFEKKQRLTLEREMLGLYVSDHPLIGVEGALRRRVDLPVDEALEANDQTKLNLGGIVASLTKKYTKNGDQMATMILEDLRGAIRVVVFPRCMQKYGHLLTNDAIVIIKGRIDYREDEVQFIADTIEPFEPVAASPRFTMDLTHVGDDRDLLFRVKDCLLAHPGESEVVLHLPDKVVRLPEELRVDAADGLLGGLRAILDPA